MELLKIIPDCYLNSAEKYNINIYLKNTQHDFSSRMQDFQKGIQTSHEEDHPALLSFLDLCAEIDTLLSTLIILMKIISLREEELSYEQIFLFILSYHDRLQISGVLLVFLACLDLPFEYFFQDARLTKFLSALIPKQIFFIIHFNYRELHLENIEIDGILHYFLEHWNFQSRDYVLLYTTLEANADAVLALDHYKYAFRWELVLLILSHERTLSRLTDPDLSKLMDVIPIAPVLSASDVEVRNLLPQIVQNYRPLAQRIFATLWRTMRPRGVALIVLGTPAMDDLSLTQPAIWNHIVDALHANEKLALSQRKKALLPQPKMFSPTEIKDVIPPTSPSHSSATAISHSSTAEPPQLPPPAPVAQPPSSQYLWALFFMLLLLSTIFMIVSCTVEPLASLSLSMHIILGCVLLIFSGCIPVCCDCHQRLATTPLTPPPPLTPRHYDPNAIPLIPPVPPHIAISIRPGDNAPASNEEAPSVQLT